jgi:hypothetical protein
VGRPYHVYDHDGEHLGSFADWDVAHEWAHLQALLGGVMTPLELEDRDSRVSRRMTATYCEFLVWARTDVTFDLDGASRCVNASGDFAPPMPRSPT